MNENTRKTIEEISISNTTSDLWEDLYRCESRPSMLQFRHGYPVKFRLIGPLLYGKKIFLSPHFKLKNLVSPKELIEIGKSNKDIFKIVEARVLNSAPDHARKKLHVETIKDIKLQTKQGSDIKESINFLKNLFNKRQWQPVVFSNAIVFGEINKFQASNPTVVCLSSSMCKQLIEALVGVSQDIPMAVNKKVSGLLAHDIHISRVKTAKGHLGYDIQVSNQEEELPKAWVSFILNNGLLDIHKLAKKENKKTINKLSGFVYSMSKDYKMDDVLMANVYKQVQEMEATEYIEAVEDNFNELPTEAYDGSILENTIGSLEI